MPPKRTKRPAKALWTEFDSVINNVLDLTKIELGNVTLSKDAIDVAAVLDEVVKIVLLSYTGDSRAPLIAALGPNPHDLHIEGMIEMRHAISYTVRCLEVIARDRSVEGSEAPITDHIRSTEQRGSAAAGTNVQFKEGGRPKLASGGMYWHFCAAACSTILA
ncbi:hypothetical protein HDU90_008506 [Geranomyces variabilis]|nr:hypothetical protein HDU90_008506 [Geranomyces variabilis]